MSKLDARTRLQAARLPTVEGVRANGDDLAQEEVALLALLVGGASVAEATRQHAISRRTAARRLAHARSRLGVATTAEAVAAVRFVV